MLYRLTLGIAVAAAIAAPPVNAQQVRTDQRTGLSVDRSAAAENEKSQSSPEAADQTRGMAMMWAQVYGNGTLYEGLGVVSVKRNGDGNYYVEFNRNLDGCVPLASIANPGFGTIAHGGIEISRQNGNNYGIWVLTHGVGDILPFIDRPFSLHVMCSH